MAQSRGIAAALHAANPDIDIEFVGINTAGDRDQSAPLWQMDTVGIFTRDIDEKLLAEEIDFAVHSMKDLGTQRPAGLITVAIPERAPPHDVVLFRPEIVDILRTGRAVKIGTSAPRRTELLPNFLSKALPKISETPLQIEITSLRGNVDTRLKRLHETGERALDGVVLAFAGLSRLHADDLARAIIQAHLQGLRWMILPLTVCPGAPGQGALAIEARADNDPVRKILNVLDHASTAVQIATEHHVLREYGGGCHQRFGVVTLSLPNMESPVTLIRGANQKDDDVSETRVQNAPDFTGKKIWQGSEWTRRIFEMQRMTPEKNNFPAVFTANSRALTSNMPHDARLWTSGVRSWFNLAEMGHWVEGCADGFGFDFIRPLLNDPVLSLPPLAEWGVYTHVDAADGWHDMQVAPTYRLVPNPPPECIAEISAADVVVWASGSQFDALYPHVRPDAMHVCGPGKTAQHLREKGVKNLVVLPLFD